MKKGLENIASVFLLFLAIIGIFWIVKGSFYLMSQRSTIENTLGLATLVLLTAFLISLVIYKLKSK